MLPLHNYKNTTLGITDENRIGSTNKLTYLPKTLTKLNIVEKFFQEQCHLPVQFDLMPCEDWYYPKYFTYTNINQYMFLASNSFEFNTRFFQNQLATIDWKFVEHDPDNIFQENEMADKYDLHPYDEKELEHVFFLPGTNLDYLIDYAKIDEIKLYNDDVLIKPHPITSKKHLTILGNMYGWDNIIEPEVSGHDILKKTKNVYYTDNSEIGLKAYAMGKSPVHFNVLNLSQPMIYHSFYHILRQHKGDHIELLNAFFNTPKFGMFNLNNSIDTLKNDIHSYLGDFQHFRERLKPVCTTFDKKTFNAFLEARKKEKENVAV